MSFLKQKFVKYFIIILTIGIAVFFGTGYFKNSPVPMVDAAPPPAGMYRVMRGVDGDTIDVSKTGKIADIERVRFLGMDTPETVDPRKPAECFGHEASVETKEMLSGKNIFLEPDPTQTDKDKYGRILRYVILSDGTNYNQFLVQEGYAKEYTYNHPYQLQSEFRKAQAYAQANHKGFWAACSADEIKTWLNS